MRSIQIHQYGSARDVLQLYSDTPIPKPGPTELLVRVKASAVNPVDCNAREGYGRNLFSKLWGELPLILGRDVSGEVAATGTDVHKFSVGDEIYASPLIGCYADYVVVDQDYAALKPANLNHLEAASLPFVALTTWTALVNNAGLHERNCRGKRAVVPRAAGGVGSFAVQLLKAWGAHVAAICSTRNVTLVKSLGADLVIDYTQTDFSKVLHDCDITLDTVGKNSDFESMGVKNYLQESTEDFDDKLLATLKQQQDAVYVTVCSPKMVITDQYGEEEGSKIVEEVYRKRAEAQHRLGRRYYWSFFNPSGEALGSIAKLIETGKIRPVVDRVYPLEEIAAAHEYCESKQAQGKIVIDVNS